MNSSQLTITGNRRNDLCPICGGPDIEYVEFQAAFPGGDIPRPESDPLPEGYEIEENWKPVERPQSIGFIQNNLIEMMSREKQ